MRGKLISALSAAVVGLGLVSTASATLLVDFKPLPSPGGKPEVEWTAGQQLIPSTVAGSGFTGNGAGDGDLVIDQQLVGGLAISTPVTIPGVIPGKSSDMSGTSFYDVTMKLTGLGAAGSANSFFGYIGQNLTTGTFELWSSSSAPVNTNDEVLLLKGTINNGSIIGPSTGNIAFVSADKTVTYTGGAIWTAIKDIPGVDLTGSLSWSLLNVSPLLGTTTQGSGSTTLNPFTADATGLFSIQSIPEPASVLTLFMFGSVALMVRQRRNHRSR